MTEGSIVGYYCDDINAPIAAKRAMGGEWTSSYVELD